MPTLIWGVLCSLAAAAAAEGAPATPFTIDSQGVLLKEGQPYRAVGVNYFDGFTRSLNNPEDASGRAGLKTLASYGIPFARVSFCGFYPRDWKLYQTDKDAYFRLMDDFVEAAGENGIGLIPSLFWWYPCVPDLVGEPCSALGDPKSKTRAIMKQYTSEVVGRYKNSPTIWAWELGNEYNLAIDLPNAADCRPWTWTEAGCPATRSAADDMTSAMLVSAVQGFAEEIRRIDPAHLITTGNSTPRPSEFHQRKELSWTIDSRDELMQTLAYTAPDPTNLVSVHVYPGELNDRFKRGATITYPELLSVCVKGASRAGKPLFVGEFGPPPDDQPGMTREEAKRQGLELLKAIEDSDVALAALWVFDFAPHEHMISVTPVNHRGHFLEALRDANRRLHGAADHNPQ